MNKEEYIKKWLNDELNEEERLKFEQTEDFKSLQKLSYNLRAFKSPEYDVEAELDKVMEQTFSNTKVISVNWFSTPARVAAAVVFIVGIYFLFFNNSKIIIETMAGKKTEIYLPDSSLVVLNANSRLTYNVAKWDSKRSVSLNGEAFFKVAKGSRFDVITKSGIVSVLGTRFDVKERTDYFEVVCYEGLVRVTVPDTVQELTSNGIFRILNGEIETREIVIAGSSPAWINNESKFESVPFQFVVEEFKIQYNIKVLTENVDTKKLFTGSFDHTDINLALEAITRPVNLKYRIKEDGNVVLSGDRN